MQPNLTELFPFTQEHINHFKKELEEAGGFNNLMIKKRALTRNLDAKGIRNQKGIEKYKRKFLTGVYESLRPMFDTDIPITFWGELYDIILKEKIENI